VSINEVRDIGQKVPKGTTILLIFKREKSVGTLPINASFQQRWYDGLLILGH
jgi:hypothetical protein